VLLTGMMGAGKTTVGHAIAVMTGWPYLDNDELLRRTAGRDAAAVLAHDGEAGLRRAEAAVLDTILASPPPLVGSVAAGVVLDTACRQRMGDGGFVVFLRTPVSVLVQRVGTGTDRPWIDGDATSAFDRLQAGREALYLQVADLVLDTPGYAADELARRIVAAVTRAGEPRSGSGTG
jgi:shikimate kinase